MNKPCPMCGKENKSVFHTNCMKHGNPDKKSKTKIYHNVQATKHLHYFCECKYDYIGPTKEDEDNEE